MAKNSYFWALTALAGLLAAGCGGDNGTPSDGGCTPLTQQAACTDRGKNCGNVDDGCGNTVFCGGCTGGQTCGGGGTPNVCGRNSTGTDAGVADAGAGPLVGKVGSACTASDECQGTNAFCIYGFCTRVCGSSGVSNCNAVGVSDPNGPYGGQYSCFPLGTGYNSFCWPNGSGATCTADGGACPRAGEQCISGKCQYPRAGTTTSARLDMKCHRDQDCKPSESCLLFFNLDSDNVRSEGVCLYNGSGETARKPGGAACGETADPDAECGSFNCANNECVQMCVGDSDCSANHKCYAIPVGGGLQEYATEYVGFCIPWAGSRTTCTSNGACPSGETCSLGQDFAANDVDVTIKGACMTVTNPSATGAIGARCTDDAQCKSGSCIKSPVTGVGYCTDVCLGGDADCGGGTSCRQLVVSGRDPSTTADDLRAGFCVQAGVGAPCSFDLGCKACTSDAQCNAGQGVTCQSGVCRDAFGRCADPCRTDCTPGGANNGGCSTGYTCTTEQLTSTLSANYCADASGECERADIDQVIQYEDGRCGDAQFLADGGVVSPQQDLCYYYGRQTLTGNQISDVFLCGSACPAADGGTCAGIPTLDGGAIATTCRSVFEFGVNVPDGGGVIGGALRGPQCAPTAAFTGQVPAADGGAATDGGVATDGGAN